MQEYLLPSFTPAVFFAVPFTAVFFAAVFTAAFLVTVFADVLAFAIAFSFLLKVLPPWRAFQKAYHRNPFFSIRIVLST